MGFCPVEFDPQVLWKRGPHSNILYLVIQLALPAKSLLMFSSHYIEPAVRFVEERKLLEEKRRRPTNEP